ncbi:MAG: hypothetical protein IT459_12395 [Planctomycetes bacterium]|nr:hypothetical protein [Planctomycetota bacterium]
MVRIAGQQAVRVLDPVEKALRAYKLGLEAMDQHLRAEYVVKRELRLQRELCRFLVEREIPAYGTKFGRSEVDLRAEQPRRSVVIEVKLLKKAPPLCANVARDSPLWISLC